MDEHHTFAVRTGSHRRLLLWLMAASLFSFWLWATSYKIDQQVKAAGEVIPSGQAIIIQHLEGGIVSKIEVTEGGKVAALQPLFQISGTQAQSTLGEIRIQVTASELQITRLKAEIDGADKPDFSGIKDAQPYMIESETRLFNSHIQNLKESLSVLEEQLKQKQLRLEDLRTQLINLKAEMQVAQKQYDINKGLFAAGAMSETRFLDTKSTLQNFVTRIGQTEKAIPVTAAEGAEAQSRINELKEKQKSGLIEDLKKAELALNQLKERSVMPTDQLRRSTVVSPVAGIVNKIYVNTIDGVVKPGDKLAEITPVEGGLIVEARVLTKDRGLIWAEQQALVKISAYDYSLYGGVKGVVKEISPDTLTDEKGQPYYRVRIVMSQPDLGKDKPILPGMTVQVNILSNKITIWQYLMQPVWQVTENAFRDAG